MSAKIIVEIRGGVCVGVYSTDPDVEVEVVDRDNFDEPVDFVVPDDYKQIL